MEENHNTRFIRKYPNGWCIQGNNDPRWMEFNKGSKTNISGRRSNYYYYTNFNKERDYRIRFDFCSIPSGKLVISVDEFFNLYENTNQEPQYEIY